MSAEGLVDRIESFVTAHAASTEAEPAPAPDTFEALALEAFAFQHERIEPHRRLAEARGVTPGEIGSWREVPAVPAAAFESLDLAVAPAAEVFRSSGTGGERSVHRHPFPHLYRATIDAAFPAFVIPGAAGGRLPILSLVPSRERLPDSSLSFMADHVVSRWGEEATSPWAFEGQRIDLARSRSWLAARQRSGRPGLVLATTFALVDLLDGLDRLGLRLRLPPGSAVMETGGTKGRSREVAREELTARLVERLDLPPGAVVGEYGMTELTSQCYTRSLAGGDPALYVAPPWVRVRVLDPETLEEAPAGEAGLISVFDLANVGSAVHVLTQDLGRADEGGFRVLGRAPGAELRGCSLVVEEMAAG